jgi:hypothetical protein
MWENQKECVLKVPVGIIFIVSILILLLKAKKRISKLKYLIIYLNGRYDPEIFWGEILGWCFINASNSE